jgi:hypothetical protein
MTSEYFGITKENTMKAFCAAIATIAAASSAFAAKTEYYYQPAAGKQALELSYDYKDVPAKIDNGTTESDFKVQSNDLVIDYAYGFNANNAIGANTFFGNAKTTSGSNDNTASGLGDIHAYYKGFTDIWHYGADLGLSLDKMKMVQKSGSSFQDNRSSGGMSFKANGGLLIDDGGLNYGADLSYTHFFERETDETPASKTTGGDTVKVAGFTEYNYGPGFVGGELSYNLVSSETIAQSGSADAKSKAEGFFGLKVNGSYDFNEMFTGLASIGFDMHSTHDLAEDSTTEIKAYNATEIKIGARMNF